MLIYILQVFYFYNKEDAVQLLDSHEWEEKVVIKVEIEAGQSAIIPAGAVHAVHTPVDTAAFVCNFFEVSSVSRYVEVTMEHGFDQEYGHKGFQQMVWDMACSKKLPLSRILLQYLKATAPYIEKGSQKLAQLQNTPSNE